MIPAPDYHYSYLTGALLFAGAWVLLYVFAKTHRAQMLWGTAIAAPFALTAFLFIPEYWSPPSLFNLAERYGISIEDVIWSAAVGGIASAVAEILFGKRLRGAEKGERPERRRYGPLLLMAAVFVILEILRPADSIYNMIVAFAAGAGVVAVLRPDLRVGMLCGASVFAVVYLLLFAWLLAIYSEFITRYYNTPRLLGVYILGVPVEEPLFALAGGAVWAVLYEYVRDYRLASAAPPRLIRATAAGTIERP